VLLSGAVVGSGPVGAVLIHEYPRDYCGWLPYSGYGLADPAVDFPASCSS
jgi:hypothetical protein